MKLATTSPRVAQRQAAKREAAKKEHEEASGDGPSKTTKTPKQTPKAKVDTTLDSDRKSKRQRTLTQPYQSPLPELALISKLSSTPTPKPADEKLIVFYK